MFVCFACLRRLGLALLPANHDISRGDRAKHTYLITSPDIRKQIGDKDRRENRIDCSYLVIEALIVSLDWRCANSGGEPGKGSLHT
jgi:hypothetical protein